eukprot:Blabericola_migrator_1__8098@NODE_416_length_8706_cov_42_211136_g328_i0_p1_GENE_NODE_416_length_8706_cov_42_211136_g328_i0NODE_416_length_8706_cov_42_211136_g328_i0_p1_ORF_typecomplete_len1452_score226_32Kelch_3/PF13415_6/8_6e02Kelch_3/PF13415_6/2e03Kelch_3/PF13415_6/4_3e08Kelch_3/PF13415_6/0_01Kelch_3/PF13415_6/9_1e02Kelch_4/PF13418_6/1_7e02Kelch_4/PF13418_6/9_9e03Kelch_4/PF13418_6/0_013Kelch_4/PF13418_6/0_0014Kelch_4/PF13418_6/2_7e03Kelch_4/PF13418_6/5_8e03HATPase_c_3/PF13589_6/1e07Kelch_6/PF1
MPPAGDDSHIVEDIAPLEEEPQQSELSNVTQEHSKLTNDPVDPGLNEGGPRFTLAFQLDDSVVWAVNTHTWNQIRPPLAVNEENFRHIPLLEWTPFAKTFSIRSAPQHRVVYVVNEDESQESSAAYRAIAIEVRVPKLDVGRDLNGALQLAMDAHVEFEADIARAIKAGVLNNRSQPSPGTKPTLGQLLSALLAPNVLTPEQREQIHHITFSFLQHELSLSRAYQHISQVVGLSTMRLILKSLTAEAAKPALLQRSKSVPVAHEANSNVTLMDVSKAPALSGGVSRAVPSCHTIPAASGFPTPTFFFKSAMDQKAFFAQTEGQSYLQQTSEQHATPFWIELPEHEEVPDRYGHHIVDNGGVWLLIGGMFRDKTFSFVATMGGAGGWLDGWEFLTIVYQLDYKSVTQPLIGMLPQGQRHGSTCLLTGDLMALEIDSDCLVVFGGNANPEDLYKRGLTGGVVTDGASVAVNNELYVLDLQNLKWLRVDEQGSWPEARAYHVSGLVLKEVEPDVGECEITGFFIAGGLGPEMRVLDDIWYFSFGSGSWMKLDQTLPAPLWGASVAYAGINTYIIQGGMTAEHTATGSLMTLTIGPGEGEQWIVQMKSLPLVPHPMSGDEEVAIRYLSRCFASTFLLSVKPKSIRLYEFGSLPYPSTADSKSTLLICGGHSAVDSKYDLVLVDVHVNERAEITRASFVSRVEPQLRPFSPDTTLPPPKIMSTTSFFNCISPIPSTRPKPACPSLFIHGGMLRDAPDATTSPRPLETSRIISIHSVDPFELSWFGPVGPRQGSETTDKPPPPRAEMDDSQSQDEEGIMKFLKRSSQAGGCKDTLEVCRLFTEHLRHNAAWMCGINFTPGVFQSLGSLVKWPFSAVGHLMENASVLSTRSTHISVEIGVMVGSGVPYIAFQDNGRGLPFTAMNRALKRFGNWDGPSEKRDLNKGHQTLQYGMGMKFAFARLAQSALVISRTKGTIGVSLFSQSLLFHADSQAVTCPACFWRLPSKDTIFPEAEHWKHQQKIQQYSPFRTAAALAEQINALGAKPGTRIIFFDFKPVYPLDLAFDPADTSIRLNSCPAASIYTDQHSVPASPLYRSTPTGLVSFAEKIDVTKVDMTAEMETFTIGGLKNIQGCANGYKTTSSFMLVPTPPLPDSSHFALTPMEKEMLFDNVLHCVEAKAAQTSMEEPDLSSNSCRLLPASSFPCWQSARDSIDYSLSTYMYWSMLFSPVTLWHSGVPLVPRLKSEVEPASVDTPTDPFKRSLWRYLKANLHGMVELDYLFQPEDAHAEGYGIIGFLNPLDTLIDTPMSDSAEPRVYEAGVLLYYKERLVKRMFVPFPAPPELLDRFGRGKYPPSHFAGKPTFMFPCTAVIHVPDWLYPNAAREDFVAERSPVFDDFSFRLKTLIAEYLSVCLDNEARDQWTLQRGETLLREAGKMRPLSPMLHMALLKSNPSSTGGDS